MIKAVRDSDRSARRISAHGVVLANSEEMSVITTVEMTDVEKTTRDLVGQVTDDQKAAWLPAGASTARSGNPACANRPDCHL